jgi:hypothetical protein
MFDLYINILFDLRTFIILDVKRDVRRSVGKLVCWLVGPVCEHRNEIHASTK